METKKNETQEFEDQESNFNFTEWLSVFLHYWYLFVISIIIAFGLSVLNNRKWVPSYKTAGTIIIEEFKSSSNTQALMQGFGVQGGYKNINNQVIMLKSYDLIAKVIDSLPQFKVDYISIGRFKTQNLYTSSPITIQVDYVDPKAYNVLFKIQFDDNKNFTITPDDSKQFDNLNLAGKIGNSIQNNLFFITVNSNYSSFGGSVYFMFRDKESLVNEFVSRLQLDYVVEGSSVIEISLESAVPGRDEDFINKLCETSLRENLERKNEAAEKTIKFIDSQLVNVQKSLSSSEDEMTNFRQKNKIVDVTSHSVELLGKSKQYETELTALKLRETYLDYLTNYLKTNLDNGSIVAPSSLGLNEPMLLTLVQQINETDLKRGELSEKNMYYSKYTNDINNLKKAINEVTKNMRLSLKIEKEEFKKRYDIVQNEIRELPKKEIEMISIERKYKVDDNYYTFFLQKRAESEILKSSNTPDNNILDKARIKSLTNGSDKSQSTLIFLFLGLLIPAVFVVLKELLNSTIHSAKDVENNSSFPLIGTIRHTNSLDPLLITKNPRSSFTEMFRVIRTRIEFIVQRKKDMIILVTSGESGDGKTYFSINLAGIYSMASSKTLLVDMDIRKPSVAGRLNIFAEYGVTNYLAGQSDLNSLILKIPGVDFDFLPGGTVPPNAGELIRSEKLIEMFKELRTRYDHIIIDTSPIGIVADAYSLANISDVNLFVVRNAKTNKSFYKKLSAQLKSDKLPNLYTVINDISIEELSYSRYYSKKYTYGYGYGYGYTSGLSSKKKINDSNKYFQYYQDDREL